MGTGDGKQNRPKMGTVKQMFLPATLAVTQPEIARDSTLCRLARAALKVSDWADISLLAENPDAVKSGTSAANVC